MQRILVIEDDKAIREAIPHIISTIYSGYEISTASDGREGLRKIKSLNPDLIITDLNLPGAFGTDLYNHARHNSYMPDVVFMSGTEPDSYLKQILEKDSRCSFLTKPFGIDSFRQVLDKYLIR